MKRLLYMMFLLLVLSCFLSGCSNSTAEQNISAGTYVMEASEGVVKPNVRLEDSGKFIFIYSMLSSYLPVGYYAASNGDLILKTDDDRKKYVFKIKDGTLIFNGKKSSEIPTFANVPDGAIFEYAHELSNLP